MGLASEEKECAYNVKSSIREALPHLIRLEAFFRARGIDVLSEGMDDVLCAAENLLSTTPAVPAGELAGAPPPADQDQQRYSAG